MLTSPTLDIKGNRKLVIETEPTVEPCTADEVKLWARIDGVDEDSLIGEMITSARKMLEHYTRRTFIYTKRKNL